MTVAKLAMAESSLVYPEMRPQRTTRPWRFMRFKTSCMISPPTFSKSISMPLGAGGGGDDKGFALLRRRDFHAEKSSEAVETEHTQEDGVRNEGNLGRLLEEALRGRVDDNVFLKAGEPRDAVAFFVIGMARLDDFGETARAHDFADLDSGQVTIDGHPDAHRRIDREIFHARKRLAVFHLGYWGFGELQIAGRKQSFRARLQPKLAIGIRHVRKEYLRRRFRDRLGRDLRCCHRKNRRRARHGFLCRRRR